MRQPFNFMLHADGVHDPTIVRAIHTAAQFAYERTEWQRTEAIVLNSAKHITDDANEPASAMHWLGACAVARSQYARSRALAADLFEPDRLDSRRFTRLLVREQRRYDLPDLPGWPFTGKAVERGLRGVQVMMLQGSLREDIIPAPPSYVERVVVETAQLAVGFHDDKLLQITQERFFRLGSGFKSRARLAEYLHPYPTGPNSSSPEERLSRILAAASPRLYVRQSYNDRHALRHGKMSDSKRRFGKRIRCDFSAEQILDGAEGIPDPLRKQAVRYLAAREDPASAVLNPESSVLNRISLDFIKSLLPERDGTSLKKLSEHNGKSITKVLSHTEYVSLRRAVKKLPDSWSHDRLVAYAEAYLKEQERQAAKLDMADKSKEQRTASPVDGDRDDSLRFGRAVLRFTGPPEDLDAYTDLVRDPSMLAAVRVLRQTDFEREVRAIPSGWHMKGVPNEGP